MKKLNGENRTIENFHWPILGHSHIKRYLQSSIINDELSHAYIFVGPRHVGKFFCAKLFANSILCSDSTAKKPCNKCIACKQFQKLIHPDYYDIRKPEDKKHISVQQIRDVQYKLALQSFLASYKIVIIDDADNLNEQSANALLKTLEEPTKKTIFFLILESLKSVPQTIHSRCQVLNFNTVPTFQIQNWLITKAKDKGEAKIIAQFCEGKPGIAQTLLEDKTIIEERNEQFSLLLALLQGGIGDKLSYIDKLYKDYKISDQKKLTDDLLRGWISIFHDALYIHNNILSIINLSLKKNIEKISLKYSIEQCSFIIGNLVKSRKKLLQSVSPRLIVENFALTL